MLDATLEAFLEIIQTHSTFVDFLMLFTPFVLLLELPLLIMVILGIFIWANKMQRIPSFPKQIPKVTCALICYSEGDSIIEPIYSLAYQLYSGEIEILVIIDGAIANKKTHDAALSLKDKINSLPNRELKIIPKYKRGGRVSSTNLGIQIANGKIFMALDGDTTFDNDMIIKAVQNFDDPNVVALAGNLRVKNHSHSLITRLQTIEYMLSIAAGKTGLSSFNMVNIISGAFGAYRIETLKILMGWDNGAAEDFDITMRIKEHFAAHPNWRIVFDPHVIGHTEVPDTFFEFFKQRIRWEGDLFYVLMRKYINNIRPGLLGGFNYLFTLIGVYFFQIIMPFVITIYTILMLIFLPLDYILGLSIIVYAFYFIMLLIFYIIYMLLISERPKEDLEYAFFLPLFPIFTYLARINASLALLHSIINKSHLDSNMAPWWVLKKGNY